MKCIFVIIAALSVACSELPPPRDPYHSLHLPGAYRHYKALAHHYPPRPQHPQRRTSTAGGCAGTPHGYRADVASGCERYYLCHNEQLVSADQCVEGTLFNEQFQVCDHFYNVRCSSPYEDL